MVGKARGNLMNVQERGEHEHQQLTYSRFKHLDERKGGRMLEFDGEMGFGRTDDRRPGNPRFPAR